jgi:hypothetical protein
VLRYKRWKIGSYEHFDLVQVFVEYASAGGGFPMDGRVDWVEVQRWAGHYLNGGTDDKLHNQHNHLPERTKQVFRETAQWIVDGFPVDRKPKRGSWVVAYVATLGSTYRESFADLVLSGNVGDGITFVTGEDEYVMNVTNPERVWGSKTEVLEEIEKTGREWFRD